MLRDAPAAGYVHVAPRVRAIRPARAFVDLALAELRACARDAQIARSRRTVTGEGEHALIVSLTAMAADHRIGRELGFVFTDDFAAVIDATFDARHAAVFQSFVAQLVRELPLCAERSRRRVEFKPPQGWASRSRGLLTHVYAPSYSIDRTFLSVLPAEPHSLDSSIKTLVYEDILDDLEDIELLPNRPVVATSGLSGNLMAVRGKVDDQPMTVSAVILYDHKHRYTVRLSTQRELAPEEVMLSVASTIRPVPDRAFASSNALSHFAD